MRMAGSLDRRNDKRIAKVETDMWTMKLMSIDYYRPEAGVHCHHYPKVADGDDGGHEQWTAVIIRVPTHLSFQQQQSQQ